jgi:archaellum component FlaC
LGAPAYTSDITVVATDHAKSVLGTGIVSVVLDIDGKEFELQRSVSDRAPRGVDDLPTYDSPIVLSQSELEKMALDEAGRLRLLDDFRSSRQSRQHEIEAAQATIASLTAEIRDISADLADLRERQDTFASVGQDLELTEQAQKDALASLKELEPARAAVSRLDATKAEYSVQTATLSDAATALQKWHSSLTRVFRSAPVLPGWPANGGSEDLLAHARETLRTVAQAVEDASKELNRSLDSLQGVVAAVQKRTTFVDDEIRPLRRSIDETSKEAGTLTERISELRQQSAQSRALADRTREVSQRLEILLSERRQRIDDLEMLRLAVFDERSSIAASLNEQLGPLVHVSVTRAGLQTSYSVALANALQGSGVRYNALAPQIAERVSPRELAEAVERLDAIGLAAKAGIPDDRAQKVITHLAGQSMSEILTSWVDDGVGISLLDGRESKHTSELSTGQRCTAILPILLTHRERVLVMDQPEDNLDNAFVVDTLIKAIRSRSGTSQLIASTHNPNIPVLGDASNVALMSSTGSRGFVECQGALEDAEIVNAITRVMEGGREAFRTRAEFYGSEKPSK